MHVAMREDDEIAFRERRVPLDACDLEHARALGDEVKHRAAEEGDLDAPGSGDVHLRKDAALEAQIAE
jgi:hypothetical protein